MVTTPLFVLFAFFQKIIFFIRLVVTSIVIDGDFTGDPFRESGQINEMS